MISQDQIKHISILSKIHLSKQEFEKYSNQIDTIIKYLDTLDEIELTEIDPTEITKEYLSLREDVVNTDNKIDINQLSKNTSNGFIKGPGMK